MNPAEDEGWQLNPLEDKGWRHLASGSAEEELRRRRRWAWASWRDELVGEARVRWAEQFVRSRINKGGKALVATMLRNALTDDDRRRKTRLKYLGVRLGPGAGSHGDGEAMVGGLDPFEPESLNRIGRDSGAEWELELESPSIEQEWEKDEAERQHVADFARLLATFDGLRAALSVIDRHPDDRVACLRHHGGCPGAFGILAIAHQMVNTILNLAHDGEWLAPDTSRGPPERRAGSLHGLFLAAVDVVDPGRYDGSPAGRKRRERVMPCILYRLWFEALQLQHQGLTEAFGRELAAVYEKVLAGSCPRRARTLIEQWLRDHRPSR